jgi:hypothetical protein
MRYLGFFFLLSNFLNFEGLNFFFDFAQKFEIFPFFIERTQKQFLMRTRVKKFLDIKTLNFSARSQFPYPNSRFLALSTLYMYSM